MIKNLKNEIFELKFTVLKKLSLSFDNMETIESLCRLNLSNLEGFWIRKFSGYYRKQ